MKIACRAALLLICGLFALALLPARAQSLNLRVYVEPFQSADADLAKSIREKLIVELGKRGVLVAESGEGADAVLSGTGLVHSSFATRLGHRPALRIRAGMRLVNRNGVAIWTADVTSARFAVSESASFVDKASAGVVEALTQEARRRNSEPAMQAAVQK